MLQLVHFVPLLGTAVALHYVADHFFLAHELKLLPIHKTFEVGPARTAVNNCSSLLGHCVLSVVLLLAAAVMVLSSSSSSSCSCRYCCFVVNVTSWSHHQCCFTASTSSSSSTD